MPSLSFRFICIAPITSPQSPRQPKMTSKAENSKLELVALQVEVEESEEEAGESEEDALTYSANIVSQISLKKMHPSEKMSKDEILRRIRHHKRVKKVKNAVEALFISPRSTTATTNPRDHVKLPQKWVDDAFAAP